MELLHMFWLRLGVVGAGGSASVTTENEGLVIICLLWQ